MVELKPEQTQQDNLADGIHSIFSLHPEGYACRESCWVSWVSARKTQRLWLPRSEVQGIASKMSFFATAHMPWNKCIFLPGRFSLLSLNTLLGLEVQIIQMVWLDFNAISLVISFTSPSSLSSSSSVWSMYISHPGEVFNLWGSCVVVISYQKAAHRKKKSASDAMPGICLSQGHFGKQATGKTPPSCHLRSQLKEALLFKANILN